MEQMKRDAVVVAEKIRTDAMAQDPQKRDWAIGRADYYVHEFIQAGINIPDVRGAELDQFGMRVFSEYGYDVFTVERAGVQISIKDDGSFQSMGNSEAGIAWAGRGEQMSKDPDYARSILDSDIMSTATMRAKNDLILKIIRPESWSDYKLRSERVSPIQQDRSRGWSSGEFDGYYHYSGYMNGFPCDGKFAMIQYDRVLGAPTSISIMDLNLDLSEPDQMNLDLAEARQIAHNHIRRLRGWPIESIPVCEITKITYPVIDSPGRESDYDTDHPQLAHRIRLTWRKKLDDAWYLDDVTVSAMDGAVLNSEHMMVTSAGPLDGDKMCEDFW